MLWAQSAISIPHVTPPGSIGPAAVNVDVSFYPTGQFYSATLLYNRPDFTLDGFPFLMEGFRLNGTWETIYSIGAETPKWNANAGVDPPSNNWFLRGFVELKGRSSRRALARCTARSVRRPNAYVLGWDSCGLLPHLRAEKVWVDLDVVKSRSTTISWSTPRHQRSRGTLAVSRIINGADDAVPPLPAMRKC
jgi:hypothetical protein